MPSITFMQGTTVPAVWLNDVNDAVFNTIPTLAPLNSPNFSTPSLGVATAVSINGATVNSSVLSGTNTGDQLTFKTISVAGQADVVADTTTDTLTFAAGTGISITTNAATDTVTITNTRGSTGLTLLTTYTTVGGETSLDFFNLFSSTYDDYMIRLDGLCPASTTTLQLRVAQSGTPSVSAVYYLVSTAGTSATISGGAVGGGRGVTGTVTINNVNAPTLRTIMASTLTETTAGATYTATSSTYAHSTTAVISGFQIYPASGSFTAGRTLRVYGYNNV